ncbi:molybdenum ABC transporter ATP-binding protein [Kushneria phosphatilytica]|uniref:Molybdenum ABC transporter ATP-binding protein n=1 Tax=Kushneria phosphatilytica TaxID=657387 RepID=A0A1S1NUE5_9GAMM|nr:molybdenum ABC transporter ATP-binding protein [Kushneria phosphatilytica]OHV13808.1 molybdenum ABC transporter ATP-binding protein [Kushneria phosphatilytica]QEL10360.1 molybdenum ABC transporter ATP-binding protein [Kushneria phosphatilytica]
MLEVDVTRRLGDFTLEAALTAPDQGVTALFGESGSGKTSLLRLLAGLDRPDRGVIRLDGEALVDTGRGIHVPAHKRQLGVVFQEARLFPHYRVRGNLCYALHSSMHAEFERIVTLLGIDHLLDRMPGALSGGEARRVSIGRALLSGPRMLLMDEPLTGLDGARKQELLDYITRLAREVEIPIIFVSHDTDELMAVATRLALVEQGRITASGELDDMLARLDLSDQLGGFEASSRLHAVLEAPEPDYQLIRARLPDGQLLLLPAEAGEPGERIALRIRVRDVALALEAPARTSFRNLLTATIEEHDAERERATVELTLRVGKERLRSRVTRHAFDELGLERERPVVAMIRSVSLSPSGQSPRRNTMK